MSTCWRGVTACCGGNYIIVLCSLLITDRVSSLCPSQDSSTTTFTASRKPSRRCLMSGWRFNRTVNCSVTGGGADWLWPMEVSATPTEDWWHISPECTWAAPAQRLHTHSKSSFQLFANCPVLSVQRGQWLDTTFLEGSIRTTQED